MAADTSIYGMIQAPKFAGPMETFGQATQIRNLVNQGQLQDLQRTQLVDSMNRQQQLRDLFASGGATPEKVMAIDPNTGMALQKHKLESEKTQADLQKTRIETFGAATKQLRDLTASVNDDAGMSLLKENAMRLFGPEVAARMNIPDRFDPAWKEQQILTADALLKKIEDEKQRTFTAGENQKQRNFTAGQNSIARAETARHNRAMEGNAADRLNQPVWDSERGVWVQKPKMGGSVMAGASLAGAGGAGVATPDGLPSPKLTESQGNATAFGMRASEAHKILNELEAGGTTNSGIIKSTVSGALGLTPFVGDKLEEAAGSVMNVVPSVLGGPNEAQQRTEQARRDFVNAILRKESGAVISPVEFANASRQYFPQPGDSQSVIEQKRQNREMAIKALAVQAGPGAKNIAPIQPVKKKGEKPQTGGIKFLGFENSGVSP